MSNLDYQAQLTLLYNKLVLIDASLSKLALMSNVNTVQINMMASLNSLLARVQTLEYEVDMLKVSVANLITELRNKE